MKTKELEKIWLAFADIAIKIDEEIRFDFYCWEKGTSRFVPPKIGMVLV